jgi:LytR cell envelope-related transcriptional attenuator
MEGGPETQGTPAEGDPGRRDTRVLSPEEVARNFLRQGDPDPRTRRIRPPRRNLRAAATTAAVAVGAGAVLAGLAAFILLPNGQANPPSAQARSHPPVGAQTTTSTSTTSTSTTSTVPLLAHDAVTVDVLNAYGSGAVAGVTATALGGLGFSIGSVTNAPSDIAPGQPSQILYGPSDVAAANTLAQTLSGPVTEIPTADLSGNHIQLWVASPQLIVKVS